MRKQNPEIQKFQKRPKLKKSGLAIENTRRAIVYFEGFLRKLKCSLKNDRLRKEKSLVVFVFSTNEYLKLMQTREQKNFYIMDYPYFKAHGRNNLYSRYRELDVLFITARDLHNDLVNFANIIHEDIALVQFDVMRSCILGFHGSTKSMHEDMAEVVKIISTHYIKNAFHREELRILRLQLQGKPKV